ncbi:hypothetical protein HG530_003209 [Fusarium avenaceum]|nr:hypothetical protein HG530_003209 [Fusarium avenaceum]
MEVSIPILVLDDWQMPASPYEVVLAALMASQEVDVQRGRLRCRGPRCVNTREAVILNPHLVQEGGQTSHGAESGRVAKLGKAIFEKGSECAARDADGTANEAAVGIEGHLGACISHLSQADLLAKGRHVLAECEVVHAVLLKGLEAGDLRDKAGVELREVLLAGHVEGSLHRSPGRIADDPRKVKLLHQADSSLEVLVPRNVQKAIVISADDGLEEDEAKGGLKDLLVVLVLLERLAESPDGGITVAHDVVVNILSGGGGMRLEVLGGHAQTAVKVGAVGLKSRKD